MESPLAFSSAHHLASSSKMHALARTRRRPSKNSSSCLEFNLLSGLPELACNHEAATTTSGRDFAPQNAGTTRRSLCFLQPTRKLVVRRASPAECWAQSNCICKRRSRPAAESRAPFDQRAHHLGAEQEAAACRVLMGNFLLACEQALQLLKRPPLTTC